MASWSSSSSWSLAFYYKAKESAMACSISSLSLYISSIWSWTLSSTLSENRKKKLLSSRIFFSASASSSLFLEIMILLNISKLSHTRIWVNIFLSLFDFKPLRMHFSRVFSVIPVYSTMLSIRMVQMEMNYWKILVYSNLFYSMSWKWEQFSSMKSRRGFFQMGETRYCLMKS